MGDGVFETCGAFGGTPFLLDRHLERLQEGLHTVGIEAPAALSSLSDLIRRVVDANGLQDSIARVRITVSRGVEEVPNQVYRQFLGGYGLGSYLMWKHFPAGTDPLAPEACFAMRPLSKESSTSPTLQVTVWNFSLLCLPSMEPTFS